MSEPWPEISLSQLATITMGQSPEAACISTDERGLAFLQGCAEFGARVPNPKFHCFPPLRVGKAGSVLISVRAPVGMTNFAEQDYCIGRGLGAVTARPEAADSIFLLHAIEQNVGFLHRRSQGSTFLAIGAKELSTLPVPALPLEQQRRIAEILSTVDEAIEQTEALIAKYRQIQAGLMHDLFTRGLSPEASAKGGVTWKLRPTRAQAPHLYKKSPLGWIPKEWEVSSCAAEFHIDSGITLGPHRRPAKTAHPYLRVANVFRDKVVLDKVALLEVFPGEVETLGLKTFDLLLVEGHANRNEIGRCSMVFNDAEGMLFQNHLFRLCATRIDPRYALLWLNSSHAQHYWDIHCATSSGLNTINRSKLGRMPICVPSDEEQRRIVLACFASREAEVMEARYLANLRQQKQGLMQDLLTGRVRVKVGESEGKA